MRGQGKTISQLATEARVGRSYFTRILRLAFLSPEIVRMILSGRHPRELTARRIAAETRLSIDWNEHRSMLGLNT